VGTQDREQPNLIAQGTADHPHAHAGHEAARLRQLDEAVALARLYLGDDGIRNARRCLAVHHEMAHARGPARIPPALDHPNEEIARKERRRGDDFGRDCDGARATTADKFYSQLTRDNATPRRSSARIA